MTIRAFALDFPIRLDGHVTSVILYCFDVGCYILFVKYFFKRHILFTIDSDLMVIHIQGKPIRIQCKNDFTVRVFDKQLNPIEELISKL